MSIILGFKIPSHFGELLLILTFWVGLLVQASPPPKGLFDYVPPTCFSISEEPNASQYFLYILSEKAT